MKKNIWVIIQKVGFLGQLFSSKILQTPNTFFKTSKLSEICTGGINYDN